MREPSCPITTLRMLVSLVVLFVSSSACAFFVGWLLGKALTRAKLGEMVPADRHRALMQALRKRYQRRLRSARNVLIRYKASREQIRNALKEADNRSTVKSELLRCLETETNANRARIGELTSRLASHQGLIAALRSDKQTLQRQLQDAQARFSSTEREHGLLRIERDELAARTQRLRALSRSDAPPAEGVVADELAGDQPVDETRAQLGALRENLAERDDRIQELERQLRDTECRRRDLETSLHNWKLRIAPLAFQLKRQRDRNRKLAGEGSRNAELPESGDDSSESPTRPPTAAAS
jgi:chromosome segregation ATPase